MIHDINLNWYFFYVLFNVTNILIINRDSKTTGILIYIKKLSYFIWSDVINTKELVVIYPVEWLPFPINKEYIIPPSATTSKLIFANILFDLAEMFYYVI